MSKSEDKKRANNTTKYRAPALVKGLEILEFLAGRTDPISLSGISEHLDRSRSEIFRMVQELESTGYIAKSERGEGFEITNKLFLLGLEQPRTKTLLEAALPKMRIYTRNTRQSCHLAIRTDGLIVVIARIEAPGPFSFTVRVGHRQLLSRSTSGLVLFTGQPADTQKAWLNQMAETDPAFEEAAFLEQAKLAKERGFVEKRSRFIHGVIDIGAPIVRNGIAVASLTSSCVTRIDQAEGADVLPVSSLLETAKQITQDLPASSNE